jgi:LPXTG-site transpeptidase (sortase) family protein
MLVILVLITGGLVLTPQGQIEARPLLESVPAIGLNVPAEQFLGENVSFTVTFDNPEASGGDAGYGPFIQVFLDTTGADGVYPGDTGVNAYDGLGTSSINVTYAGSALAGGDVWELEVNASGQFVHPILRDGTGNFVIITAPAGFVQGDKVIVARLPFGSFVPDQPPATLTFTVNMSNLADLGTPLNVAAQGGYQFGYTPLDDWCCGLDDPSVTLSGIVSDSVTPTLVTMTKTNSAVENEIPTGPNYPHTYEITVEVANGQTISNLDITDTLPNNVQYIGPVTGATCSTLPSTDTPGGILGCTISSFTGTATITFPFYIPLNDLDGNPVIDADSGDDGLSCNNVSILGDWTPIDTRDAGGSDNVAAGGAGTPCENSVDVKSNAIQKGVGIFNDEGVSGYSPNDTLIYTLNFQVSDYFAFDDIVITDTLSDGQHWDTSYTPTLAINGNQYSISSIFDLANYTVDETQIGNDTDPDTDGSTTVTFRVSDQILASNSIDTGPTDFGWMVGGCIPMTADGTARDTELNPGINIDCDLYDNNATTATITYRAIIQQNFTDTYPSGDASVDQGDTMSNTVTIDGQLLSVVNLSSLGMGTEADGSTELITIARGNIAKTIYSINGAAPIGSPVRITVGDKVTYRVRYVMNTSDVEDLEFTDYFPLPIFDVTDPDADGVDGPAWGFDSTKATGPGNTFIPGVVKLGPDDSFYEYANIHTTLLPTVSAISGNAVNVFYGDFDGPDNSSTIIDLLFTVTVTDEPFADGLYLTNQASVNEGSTNTDDQSTDALVQIQFTAPAVYGEKSVVATNGEGILTPAITAPSGNWTVPGSPGPRWSGNINSTWLAANSLNSNLENADAGDLVTFAIILENRGSGIKGAFDMVIKDILDSIAFEYPIAGDANSTNLQIYYGNGSGPITYTDVSNVATTPAALFGTGIKLVDPIGAGVCSAHDPNLGNNVIVITYDLRLKTGVEAGETYSNDAALTNYAGQEGGEDFANPDVEFDAEVSIDQPEIAKSLVSTEINSTGNSNIQAVIGEYATYQLVLTVPEGTTSNAEVVDRMSTGLAFADVTSVTYSSGVTSTLTPGVGASPANVAISNYNGGTGNQATYSLGTITNTNTDDATLETITIEYRSVVLNVTGNQGGSTLSNTASFTWLNSSASDTGDSITVVEPTVTVDKAAQRLLPTSGGTSVDAGDTVQYTITLTNTSGVDAFDTIVYDTFPTYLNYATLAITSVTDSASTLTAADFNLNTATGVLTTTNDFTLPGNNSRTVRLVITGVVISTITPNTSFNNDAYTQWTSMPEAPTLLSDYTTSDGERTGADGEPGTGILNDYQRHDGATLSVPQLAGTKYLVASSESATTNPRLTIGEIARFRLSMQLPEGVTTDLSMLDRLPAGMRFLNDGTAKVAFVSTNGSITSSTLSGGGLNFTGVAGDYPTLSSASITFVLPDPAVSTDRINNVDNNYDSGRDVYFKFGTITNTSDNDADNEFVVVEFNALVENIVGNQAYNNSTGAALTATTLSNDFRGYTNTATTLNLAFTSTPAVSVTVAEPSITDLTKAVNPPSGDSGDTVTYTVTFSNASGANASPAYDVVFTDFVPVKMNSVSNITVNSPAGCALQTNSGSEISGNSITVNFSVVPVSCAVTITYQATLTSAVIPGEILTNNADVIYTSLPGTEGTNGNPTGSNLDDTINIPGSGIGERTNGTGVNDYQDATDVGVEVTPVQPVKLLISSTDINSSDPNLTIGETARFRLEVSLAEGSSPAFTITDNLPTGLQYIGNAKIAFVSTGDLMTSSNIDIGNSPWITGDETTLTTITPTFDLPVSALNGAPFGDGTDPVFNFSDITNGETDASQEFVVVEFDTVVLNTSANQNTVTLTNNFTVSIDSIDRGTSNNVVITIVEPWLTAAKTIALHTGSTVYQAGSQIDYTLTFTNNGTAWAYDVSVVDDLPPYVTYDAGTISCAINSISAPAANITPVLIDAVDPQPDFYRLNINSPSTGAWDIPNSQALVCSFTATIQNSVFLNGTYTNTTDADWTSQDATPSEERVYDSGSNSYDTGTDYNVDLNQDTATVVFNVTNPAITKTVDKAEATIGDTVRYTISVTSPLGTINNLVITDTLPTGIIFDSVVSNSGFASYPGDPSGSPLTWVFGDVVITSSPATIVFDAVIADIDTNVDGTVRTNTVRLDYQNAAGTTQTPLSATALTTIRESRISTTKVVTPDTGLQSGTVLNYTMTYTSDGSITAYDVALRDDLPPHTTYNGDMVCTLTVPPAAPVLQSITVTNIPATTSYDIVPTIPGDWDLAVNSVIRCTFSATVEGSMPLIGTLTNVTDADWTSQDGIPTTPAFERVYDGGTYVNDSGTDYPNDGDQDTASAPATSNAPTGLTKTVDKPNAVVGETVRYTISLTSPLGTIHNLVLTDTLPAGMIYAGNVAYSGFGGTLIDPATPDPNDGSTSSPLTWALGDREITVSPATISFDAIVANVITNQEGTVRTNTVEMNYQNAAGVDQTPLSDDVDVTVHEPVLTIVKSITASGPFDAGDSVPYQLLITNTSGYTAYDVLVRDITAYDVSGVSYTSTGTLVNVSNISAATNEVYYSVGEFPAGATMTITYNVVLPIEVSVGERVQNDVRLTWTSQPGVNPNERIGVVADTLNDYIANDSEYFDIQLPTFSKSVDKATATIGETVTYTLTIDSPSASINAMSITDVLPAGMVLTGEPIYSWIPIPDEFNPYFGVSSPNDGTAQIDLFWDFGTVEVTASPITITYTAVVANELINQNARTITNNAELRFWDRSENEHVLNDDVAFAVIEPVLTISKQADDLTPGLGQTIDFIITVAHDASSTATAYDVVVTDTIPTGLTYVAGSINQTCGTSDESTAPQLSWTIPSLAPAATCTLTYQATLDLDAILGSSLSNTAVVTWTSLTGSPEEERRGVVDSLLDNYIDQSTVDLLASGFDLSINKDDGVEQTQTGSTLTYTINYGISGTQPATDVVITDAIPDYTYFVSAGSSPDWSCTTNDFNNTCTYTLGTLTPPFTGSLTLVVAVNATIPETVDELLNVIDIAGQGNNGTEPMENNHDEDADELVSVPELVIEKSVDGVLFAPGETVTYTINYRNEGTQNATNVVIAETIPEYTTFNAAASDPRWVCSATSCTITLPLLSAPGLGENTGSALFVLVLDSPMQAGVSQIDNVVTIADDGANGPEINTENNTDNATITVGAAPDLTITKDDGVVQVTPGEDLTYSIVVSNVGNQHATGVIVTDTLPVGVTFVSTNLGGTYTEADREIIWNLGEMEAGASVTLIVEISVDEPFTGLNPEIVNEVIVADDGTNGVDPTPENNEASDRDLISSIGKVISATNQAHTGVLNVAVGEIVTYQVTLDVAPGTTQDLILQDVLEQGLAFVGCNAITTDPDAALTLEPGLTLNGLCTMAAITASPTGSLDPLNFGRQMLINFGDITNNTTDDIVLTVEYDVVVLNSSNNLSGEQRTNQAEWTWTGGSLELTATDLTLVEPELAITKTVTPTEAFSGTIVTYTITISHTEESETDAFNTLITDLIPAALTYVPDSLEFVSGQLPTTLNDLNAPALRIGWDIFSLSDDPTVLTYQVQVTNAGPGDEVVNAATLSWTSLPGIINNQTANNPFSDERTFEPGSTVDIYGIRAEASITIPSLPATGFAPGVITSLPQQPKDSAYSAQGDLRLTIPKQNIDLPIVGVPLGKTGWDLTWLNKQIGYLEGTAYPTWDGNTGLTAHVYNADGTPGPFVNLHLLRYGDQVKIYAFGQIYTYEVRSVSKVAPNDLSSLSHTDRSTMTLITCQGYDVSKNTYNWRVVVKTVLVSITPAK